MDGDLVVTIGAPKSRWTLLSYGFGRRGRLWQLSFHDPGVRGQRQFEEAVRYVVTNPIAGQLVERWEEYDLIDGTWLDESLRWAP